MLDAVEVWSHGIIDQETWQTGLSTECFDDFLRVKRLGRLQFAHHRTKKRQWATGRCGIGTKATMQTIQHLKCLGLNDRRGAGRAACAPFGFLFLRFLRFSSSLTFTGRHAVAASSKIERVCSDVGSSIRRIAHRLHEARLNALNSGQLFGRAFDHGL